MNELVVGTYLFLLGLLILALLGFALMFKYNLAVVVKSFRENNALEAGKAVSIEELGIKPMGLWERMFRMQDNKAHSMHFLISTGIVRPVGERYFYLSEADLARQNRRSRLLSLLLPRPLEGL